MPRSFDLAPYLENKNTSLKVVTDKEKVPTDNEYFISDFESDVKNYGAVIFETLESRKIFILNLEIPDPLNLALMQYRNYAINSDELKEIFAQFNRNR